MHILTELYGNGGKRWISYIHQDSLRFPYVRVLIWGPGTFFPLLTPFIIFIINYSVLASYVLICDNRWYLILRDESEFQVH